MVKRFKKIFSWSLFVICAIAGFLTSFFYWRREAPDLGWSVHFIWGCIGFTISATLYWLVEKVVLFAREKYDNWHFGRAVNGIVRELNQVYIEDLSQLPAKVQRPVKTTMDLQVSPAVGNKADQIQRFFIQFATLYFEEAKEWMKQRRKGRNSKTQQKTPTHT